MNASDVLIQSAKPFQGFVPEVWPSSIRRPGHLITKIVKGKPVTVGSLLSQIQPKPKRTLLLGQCEDGLPLLMGLDDPAMGAILISGENSCGKTHQLEVMVASAMRLYTPDALQISILTLHPEEWAYLKEDPQRRKYIQSIHPWYDQRSEKLIRTLTNIAEMRRDGKGQATRHMVILDDLNFIEYLSYESQMNIHWLLAYGSQLGFTMLASLNAVYCEDYRYWIDIFRTRILGQTDAQDEVDVLALHPGSCADTLTPGFFRVWSEGEWLTYRLPLLGD